MEIYQYKRCMLTSCGCGTRIRWDESFLLWQERSRKNNLQLWNPFQKWHLESQNADEKRVNICREDVLSHTFRFPLFVYVFYLFTCIVFFAPTWIWCFLKWFKVTHRKVWVNTLLLGAPYLTSSPFNFVPDFSMQTVICLFYLSSCHYEYQAFGNHVHPSDSPDSRRSV